MDLLSMDVPAARAVFEALQSMIVPLGALLVPLVVMHVAVRHFLSLKAFGTSHLTLAQRNSLASRYPAFQIFSVVVIVLGSVFGAFMVQLGFMQALGLQHVY
jgi:hypothetical protein